MTTAAGTMPERRAARRATRAVRSVSPSRVLTVAVVVAVWWSATGTGLSLDALFAPGTATALARFARGAFPPNLAPSFLQAVFGLVLETIQISIIGTVLAVLLAGPLALLALRQSGEEESRAAQGTVRWLVRWGTVGATRTVFNVLRAVPDLVWALLFVVAVGLGPLPGVLALAVHSTGILGKLYAELLESVDGHLVEAGRATGASEVAVLLLVRVPAALPILVSYTLFRWECNMRAATVLGFVGAGGLGAQLAISMKLFRYDEVLTLTLALLALVALVDVVGQAIRARILGGGVTPVELQPDE